MSTHIEYKSIPLGGLEVVDDARGIVEALVAVTGIKDEVNDVIEPGAFAKTLARRTPKGVAHHSWTEPIAKALDVRELLPGDPGLPRVTKTGAPWPKQAGALKVRTMFNLDTQRGRDAYADVKFFGDQAEWSIGYQVPVGGATLESKSGTQVRHIRTMDLYEFSPVLFGAMPESVTTSVKSAQAAIQAVHAAQAALETETKDVSTSSAPSTTGAGFGGVMKGKKKKHPFLPGRGGVCKICGEKHAAAATKTMAELDLEYKSAELDELDAREVMVAMVAGGDLDDAALEALGFDELDVSAFAMAKRLWIELEEKAARHVRTPEGAKLFGQPIGSAIRSGSTAATVGRAAHVASLTPGSEVHVRMKDDASGGQLGRIVEATHDTDGNKISASHVAVEFGNGQGTWGAHPSKITRLSMPDPPPPSPQLLADFRESLARAELQKRADPHWVSGNGASIDDVIAGYQKQIAGIEGALSGNPPSPVAAVVPDFTYDRIHENDDGYTDGLYARDGSLLGEITSGRTGGAHWKAYNADGSDYIEGHSRDAAAARNDIHDGIARARAIPLEPNPPSGGPDISAALQTNDESDGNGYSHTMNLSEAVAVLVDAYQDPDEVHAAIDANDTLSSDDKDQMHSMADEYDYGDLEMSWLDDHGGPIDPANAVPGRRVALTVDGDWIGEGDIVNRSETQVAVRLDGESGFNADEGGTVEWFNMDDVADIDVALDHVPPSGEFNINDINQYIDDALVAMPDDWDSDKPADNAALWDETERRIDEALAAGDITDTEYEAYIAELLRQRAVTETQDGHKALHDLIAPVFEDDLETKAKGGADKNRGGADKLRKYWTHGEGAAKIRWGEPGDFMRCVHHLEKYLGVRAKGYCQLRHHDATGAYAGHAASEQRPGKKGGDEVFDLDSDVVADLETKFGRLLDTGKADRLRTAVKDLRDALSAALADAAGEIEDVDFDTLLAEHDELRDLLDS